MVPEIQEFLGKGVVRVDMSGRGGEEARGSQVCDASFLDLVFTGGAAGDYVLAECE